MKYAEIEKAGIYNSQIATPSIAVSKDRAAATFELELATEDGGISYIDCQSARISEGLFICAKPGQIRHTKFPFKCYYIHLNVYDEELYGMLIAVPTFIKTEKPSEYKAVFEELYRHYQSGREEDAVMCKSLTLKLIYMLVSEAKFNAKCPTPSYGKAVQTALKYIDDNLDGEIKLERIAEYVSFSPIYFHNCFKKAIGKTLHAYVEEKRIEKSINLMLTTDLTLTEIAYSCGFSSQSYYNYAFKRKMKITPRGYIKGLMQKYRI